MNEGILDRTVRVVVGIGLLSLVFTGPHSYLGLVGLLPLTTGIVGFCPMYRVLGLTTRRSTRAAGTTPAASPLRRGTP